MNIVTVCKENQCSGCMACVDICSNQAISISDEITAYNAIIDQTKCINCGLCHDRCQSNYPSQMLKSIIWKQGWANDLYIREKSSSGGVAAALEISFIKQGGIVCSCCFKGGEFSFAFAETVEAVADFQGSKFVKSNPKGIYKKIRTYLLDEKKVLFLGLPCQVSAVKNYVGEKLQKNLYTVDLICHGSPSPKILKLYLEQHGVSLNNLYSINFRENNNFKINSGNKYFSLRGIRDSYTISFLNAISYTENCYSCHYATMERVSDVTLGDSWGNSLSKTENKNGISLILCQTDKGKKLIYNSDIILFDVDYNKAIEANHQLTRPSKMPARRKEFFEKIKLGKKIDSIVWSIYPKQCFKQIVKGVLMKINFLRGEDDINYCISVKTRDI